MKLKYDAKVDDLFSKYEKEIELLDMKNFTQCNSNTSYEEIINLEKIWLKECVEMNLFQLFNKLDGYIIRSLNTQIEKVDYIFKDISVLQYKYWHGFKIERNNSNLCAAMFSDAFEDTWVSKKTNVFYTFDNIVERFLPGIWLHKLKERLDTQKAFNDKYIKQEKERLQIKEPEEIDNSDVIKKINEDKIKNDLLLKYQSLSAV